VNNPVICSVVVPTYNRRELLRHTLDSLSRQTLDQGAFEVLVVDDGSTDDTTSFITTYRALRTLRYFHQEDRGYRVARARNLGLQAAAGRVCVFVDSGVLLAPGALEAHLAHHGDPARPVAVSGYVHGFNENNEDAEEISRLIDPADVDGSIARLAAGGRFADIRESFYARYGDDFGHLPAPWLMFWCCNASAPTDLLRAVGGFDEAFQSWGAEDVDLSYRLHRAGAHHLVERAAAAIHEPHPKSYEANMASVDGNYRYFAAKYGTPIAALVVSYHFDDINEIIRQRDLPACADYLAAPQPEDAVAPRFTASDVVVVFSPHPDDDVLACGGTTAAAAAAGAQVVVLYATDGSRSHAAVLGIHQDPTPRELAEIRRKEALAGALILGARRQDVWFLGFEDTRLEQVATEFRKSAAEILRLYPAITAVLLPHEERELNADHRATAVGALAALADAGVTAPVYRYQVWDELTEVEFGFTNRAGTSAPTDEATTGAGDAEPEATVLHDIRPYQEVKARALAEHRTQVELFRPSQTRPVVPTEFVRRVLARPTEQFWVATR
jgi:LmbE family N-acetylglucosaminyl deacetylase/glycosyltransferase involved in cell wall biosynthesis